MALVAAGAIFFSGKGVIIKLAYRHGVDAVTLLALRMLFSAPFFLLLGWWATRDGDKVIALLDPYKNVTVFYGHIHQENHHMTGHIAHHSAKSLIFPLPAPGSQEKRTPLPWDPAQPNRGLGFREIEAEKTANRYAISEFPVTA